MAKVKFLYGGFMSIATGFVGNSDECPSIQDIPKSGLIFWREWEEKFGSPSKGEMRYLILHRRDRKFNHCCHRINGKIYLNVQETLKFFNESCKEV